MDLQGYVWKESDSLCLGELTSNVDTTSSSNSSLADDSVSYHDQSQSLSLIHVVLCWSLSLSLSLCVCVCVCDRHSRDVSTTELTEFINKLFDSVTH